MKKELLELYSDYLLSSFGYTTATGLSDLPDNQIGHDRITDFLAKSNFDSRYLWLPVKETVRSAESDDGVLIFDDTAEEKQRTDENKIITWHYDHSRNRTVKGVSILNCLYHSQNTDIPAAYEIIDKPVLFSDPKTGLIRRKSEVTKNELLRDMLRVCISNQFRFRYVLTDNWFSSKENMLLIKSEISKDFIMAIKSSRTAALSTEDKKNGHYVQAGTLELKPDTVQHVCMKGIDFPCLLCRQIFKNKAGSSGVLYPVSSDTGLTYDQMTALYQKRRNAEVFHKSLKSDASLSKSPTRTVRTQSSHFFASIYSFFKLEKLKIKHNLNHFALRAKLYINALKSCFQKLRELTA
ncbi:MAG: transposase [Desulfococcaceae bacterium]